MRAEAAIDGIISAHRVHQRKRERALTAREALIALQFEATFFLVCSATLRNGDPLSDEDHGRL